MKALASLLLLLACSHAKEPEQEPSTPSVQAAYDGAVDRLEAAFLEEGWVVSRDKAGQPAHIGEALLWSGLALAAFPCDRGLSIEGKLTNMVIDGNGALIRYSQLGEYSGGREVTLDGALGLYRGIAERITRCGKGDTWRDPVALHLAFVNANAGRLHPNTPPALMPEFTLLPDLLAARLGAAGEPDRGRARTLEHEVALWAALVKAERSACYRINLGLITLQTLEALGEQISQNGRDEFCLATQGTDIPTVDEWCGRGGLAAWAAGFQPNSWEYRFQRCGAWETPDGPPFQTPGLDYIVAIRQAYNL